MKKPYLNDLSRVPQLPDAIIIRHPQFRVLHEQIQECLQMTEITGEPHCMSLEGPTGAGKTTLIKDYLSHFPRTEASFGEQIDALYIPTPDNPTIKDLVSQMLEYLRDPASHKSRHLWKAKSRLKRFIRNCKVQLIILDDFQHLVRSSYADMQDISEWLKALIKETEVCVIVVGTEGAIETVLDSNEQLSRLFAAREALDPFRWDITDEQSVRSFAALIQKVEETLDMPLDDEGFRAELLGRIYYATKGILGNVMNLLRLANLQALKAEQTSIDRLILASAFKKRLQRHLKAQSNPFMQPLSEPFVPVELLTNPKPLSGGRAMNDLLST